MDLLDRLLGHDRWATAQLLNLSRGLTDAQLDREIDVGHQTLRTTFEHMIFSVEVWTAALARQPFAGQGADNSLAALSDRHERAVASFAAVARRLHDERRLEETFPDPWTDDVVERTVGTTIIHVCLHNAEHRTEARHILARLGVPDLPEGDPKEWEAEMRES